MAAEIQETGRRQVFAVLFVSNLVTMMGVGMVAPFISIYAEGIGASGVGIGFIFGSFALARGIGTPVFGRLSDLSGRKRFIVAGLFFFSVLAALYPLARDPTDLVIIRFFQGLASCVVTPISMAYLVELTRPEGEGESLGTFSISLFAGMALGPLIGGWVSHAYSMDAAFYTISALSAVTMLFVLALLPPSAPRPEPTSDAPVNTIFTQLADPQVRAVCLFRFSNAIIISSVMGFMPIMAAERGVKMSSIGVIVSGFLLFSGFLQWPFGKMADRVNRSRMIVAGQILHVIGLVLMSWMTSRAGTWAPLFFMSIGTGLAVSAATAESGRLGRIYGPGALIGLFNTAMSFGTAAGPLIAGFVYDYMGVRLVFFTLGILIFATTLPFLVPGKGKRGRF